MESDSPVAPPVVAVVVVHAPGDWFEETLDALADQDYPNLRLLFLVAGDADAAGVRASTDDGAEAELGIEDRIRVRLPHAFVRTLQANPGYGPAVNEVLRLVEGDNGFFLLCHDDVAPDPDVTRVLVEELYRSNAGAVGPKLVEWDDPGVLQAVGLGLDRFGEIDQVIEPGEVDQEQHDGVRDVFVLPSACLLVRADLFRELGGFDPAIDFHGDDVELCWRLHHSGARVVVAPIARVRHRGRLEDRRPDLNHPVVAARHRMRNVATLTGRARLPARLLEVFLLTLVELVVGLFTASFKQAWASLRGFVAVAPRVGGILARRRAIASVRRVPEREVLGLQQRGSARLNSFLRSRHTETYVGAESDVRRWRQSTTAPVIAWIVVLAAVVIGSRAFVTGGVPAVGEFLRFPESPRRLLDGYLSGWNPNGAGATAPNPTGWATLSGLSFVTLFRMGMLQTLVVVGSVIAGLVGIWRVATVFPSTRARIGALAVYAATPLVGGAMSIGSLTTLVVYAATPWTIYALRRAVGVETADPGTAGTDLVDGLVDLSGPERVRRTLQVGLVVGLAAAFAPVFVIVALLVSVALAVGSLLAFAPWQTGARYALLGAGGVAVGVLLNVPWALSWTWDDLVGPPPVGDPGRGLFAVAAFEIGATSFAYLALALYLPVLAGLALARAWRLTWAIRSAALVAGFLALAVLGDRGDLPFAAPQAGVLLVPVAVGLSLAAGAALAAFDLDVRGGSFGWRQPLGLLASAAVVVGVVPGVLAIGDGAWGTPSSSPIRSLEQSLTDPGDADGDGAHLSLLVGDARLFPMPGTEYRDDMSFAVMGDDALDVRDRWPAPDTSYDEAIVFALDQIAQGSTLRAGRLLGPLGIRYLAVPEFDGVISTTDDPLDRPIGLLSRLDRQLDIAGVIGITTFDLYENAAAVPVVSVLDPGDAEASRRAGAEALLAVDLSDATPIPGALDAGEALTAEVPAGVVHLAVPFDDRWTLTVDGRTIEPRLAFGTTMAFDVDQGGSAVLRYETSPGRALSLALAVVLWGLAIFGAIRVTVPLARRRSLLVTDETIIHLDGDEELDEQLRAVGIDPGLDLSGQIARPVDPELPADEWPQPELPEPASEELPGPDEPPESGDARPTGDDPEVRS